MLPEVLQVVTGQGEAADPLKCEGLRSTNTCLNKEALASNDPFTGKWKLNQSKSRITGEQLKITALGGKRQRAKIKRQK